jgi:quercetin dioxygenase-like cupin family protein
VFFSIVYYISSQQKEWKIVKLLKNTNYIQMRIISLNNVPKKKVEIEMEGAQNAWKQIPLSGNDGAPVYAFRVFTVEPGGYTPYLLLF